MLDDVVGDDQGRRQEDRRRARRRPRAQRAAGLRRRAPSASCRWSGRWPRARSINKAILVPAALAISAFAPWAVTPLLMIGGAFLCYEGFEKLAHKLPAQPAEDDAHHDATRRGAGRSRRSTWSRSRRTRSRAPSAPTSSSRPRSSRSRWARCAERRSRRRSRVLVGIAMIMTVGVYGFVAGIVKLDDGGPATCSRRAGARCSARSARASCAPRRWLMKVLSVAGTAAMFLVGGGILVHGIAAAAPCASSRSPPAPARVPASAAC